MSWTARGGTSVLSSWCKCGVPVDGHERAPWSARCRQSQSMERVVQSMERARLSRDGRRGVDDERATAARTADRIGAVETHVARRPERVVQNMERARLSRDGRRGVDDERATAARTADRVGAVETHVARRPERVVQSMERPTMGGAVSATSAPLRPALRTAPPRLRRTSRGVRSASDGRHGVEVALQAKHIMDHAVESRLSRTLCVKNDRRLRPDEYVAERRHVNCVLGIVQRRRSAPYIVEALRPARV
ncbi:hypothetical protein AURDEDRAFT_127513 [Auricularia subglabra TFB-10046 SS5]|nr:hypothetical protein AURDEDRAFT_127513 [Auricularia subglabra TFB-10046 SS5]